HVMCFLLKPTSLGERCHVLTAALKVFPAKAQMTLLSKGVRTTVRIGIKRVTSSSRLSPASVSTKRVMAEVERLRVLQRPFVPSQGSRRSVGIGFGRRLTDAAADKPAITTSPIRANDRDLWPCAHTRTAGGGGRGRHGRSQPRRLSDRPHGNRPTHGHRFSRRRTRPAGKRPEHGSSLYA